MQVKTTITTNETMSVLGTNFQITTFEMITEVICDICGNNAAGTKNELESRGWFCGSREQFCPECNN